MSFLVAFIRNTFTKPPVTGKPGNGSNAGGSIQLPAGGYGRAYGQHYGN